MGQFLVTTKKTFSPEELETAGSELDNLAVQCQTRKSEGSDDEEIAVKSNTYIIQAGKPMSILLLVADILQKIVELKNFFEEKDKQLHDTDDKWEEFRLAEKKLADWLQLVLTKVQKISIAESNIRSLETAAEEVSCLIRDLKENEVLKSNYYSIGKKLMALDSSQVNVLQDALSEADSKWDKVSNLLLEQESKSKTLIGMWQQCLAQGGSLKEQLDQVQDSYNALCNRKAIDMDSTASMVDFAKSTIDQLKKARHPFEMFYKRQTQLIQELQTVPSFEVSSLKAEIQSVQQKFSFLGSNLKLKLNKYESQIVIWKQITQNRDEFFAWSKETRNSLNDGLINVSDVEAARAKLERFHHDFPTFSSMVKTGIFAKLDQINEINEESGDIFAPLRDKINRELIDAEELAQKLESSLSDVDSSSKNLKTTMSDSLNWLLSLRDRALKFDDLSGSDEDIYERLVGIRSVIVELESFDDRLIPITEDIKSLHEKYEGSEVNSLMKDLSNLEKKYDALSSQTSKISSTLFGLLEKRYSDKVQDLLKCINLNKDKALWCSPDLDSDKFALNSKMETLEEIRGALKELNASNLELKNLSKVLLKLVDDEKVGEVKETLLCLDKGITEIGDELTRTSESLKSAIDLFNIHASKVEEANNWIKATEESIKTNLVANLESAAQVSGDCEGIQRNIEKYEPNIKEIERLGKDILSKHPASRIGATSDHVKSKYDHLKNDRETIRIHIRAMRDGWEDLIDYMNGIQKNVAGLAMQWSSFDESFEQVKNWLDGSRKKLEAATTSFCADLSAKKTVLQDLKTLEHDISSHYTFLDNMKHKSDELNNPMAVKALNASFLEYEALKNSVSESLGVWKGYVSEHEDYRSELEKRGYGCITIEENDKIEMLESIIGCDESVKSGLKDAQAKYASVAEHTSADGKEMLLKELKDLERKWKSTLCAAQELKGKISVCSSRKAKAKEFLSKLSDWLVEMELKVKNSSALKENALEKQAHLEELESLSKKISSKTNDFKQAGEEIGDNETQSELASLNARYHNLKKNVKDLSIRYTLFVKEHSSFDLEFGSFMEWMKGMRDDLSSLGELSGDLKVLQSRKINIEGLEEIKNSENLKYDSISELGEKLYSHTSASGKEIIRGNLRNLRSQWEELTANLLNASLSLEKCLQQFSDFTSLQEKLTKWLKDIERAMQEHTELKSSLPEKKGQLQNHSIVHQEITSHNGLVESVCTKAQELVDQTQDTTLNAYIQSIKLLFQNIGLKSKDLIDKLKSCVQDHEGYTHQFKGFLQFFSHQSDQVGHVGDIMGEKTDIDHKTSLLKDLKENKALGDKRLSELEAACGVVCKSTALKGCEHLREELNQLKENWNTHEALVDELEINIEKANGQWDQFHSDLDKHLEWFKAHESFFKDQTLMNTLERKRLTLSS
ncbi:Nesprin1like [Caligus rogercresseyi]|uniref:Nesprin1like n=1 Tax=Caligus rogercresseyi TaxID=217165 RepID=A0A7T8GKH0_CALRO|nr:Nesprin1like [Caligus rogercresseyi]